MYVNWHWWSLYELALICGKNASFRFGCLYIIIIFRLEPEPFTDGRERRRQFVCKLRESLNYILPRLGLDPPGSLLMMSQKPASASHICPDPGFTDSPSLGKMYTYVYNYTYIYIYI